MKTRTFLRPIVLLAVITSLSACSGRVGAEKTASTPGGDGSGAVARTGGAPDIGPATPFGDSSPFGGVSRPGSSSTNIGSGGAALGPGGTGIGGGFGAGGYR